MITKLLPVDGIVVIAGLVHIPTTDLNGHSRRKATMVAAGGFISFGVFLLEDNEIFYTGNL